MDGVNCNEGRLELCLLGIWGTVCDDGWNVVSSKVVCNSLGLPGGTDNSVWSAIVSWLCNGIGQCNSLNC